MWGIRNLIVICLPVVPIAAVGEIYADTRTGGPRTSKRVLRLLDTVLASRESNDRCAVA